MACLEILSGDRVVGHVCRPDGITRRVLGRQKKRFWCFKCRRRQLHTLMIFEPTQPSWYGPHTWWECPRCLGEYVLFPGREWVYED